MTQSNGRQELQAASLFSGAGGLDIGIERAGFRTVAAVDVDRDCFETLTQNQRARIQIADSSGHAHLEGTRILCSGVEDIAARDLADMRGSPDLLVGGPPCQPFSSSGSQRALHDPRGQLFEHFVRLAKELQPQVILFENVRGLVTARGKDGTPGGAIQLVKASFEELGYGTRFALLNAADFGIPQRRVRLFMIASRGSTPPEFPSPTHARQPNDSLLDERLKAWVTLGEFLKGRSEPHPKDIVRPTPELGAQLERLAPGSGLKSPGPKEPTRPGGHWGYKQGTFIADPDKPARTVTAAATPDWVRDPTGKLRRLTLHECAELQGFPYEWTFAGSRTSQFRQIGNAVPVVFGEVLGSGIAEYLAAPGSGAPLSAPLPGHMIAAIDYTTREDARNGVARVRSPHFAGGS